MRTRAAWALTVWSVGLAIGGGAAPAFAADPASAADHGSSAESTPAESTHAESSHAESGHAGPRVSPEQSGAALARTITRTVLFEHLVAFQEIADTNGGNRAAGTSGYEASAQYVEEVLHKAGYTPERQYFTVTTWDLVSDVLTVQGEEPITLGTSRAVWGTPATNGILTAPLIEPAVPVGCNAESWQGVQAQGRVALIERGDCSFTEKAEAAAAAGAIAAVIVNNEDDEPDFEFDVMGEPLPATAIGKADGAAIRAALTDGEVTASLTIDAKVNTRETFNVIADTAGGDPDTVVVVGAHLDSVLAGPGIDDNASGVAAVLATATQLAKEEPNNRIRFAFWGAEEEGLLGSNHYVSELEKSAPEELESIAAYLNFDMLGSPNHIVSVYDADQATYRAPVTVPEGSVQLKHLITGYFDSIGQPWVDESYNGRSDYQAFILAGVPSGGIFSGADNTKTEREVQLFGGTAGIHHDPNYHLPGDTLSNVNLNVLHTNAKAVAYVTGWLANSVAVLSEQVVVPAAEGTSVPVAVDGGNGVPAIFVSLFTIGFASFAIAVVAFIVSVGRVSPRGHGRHAR